jgi:hypothetical protein
MAEAEDLPHLVSFVAGPRRELNAAVHGLILPDFFSRLYIADRPYFKRHGATCAKRPYSVSML